MPASNLEATAPFRFGTQGPECVLFHGFTGSPWELRPLADALAEAGFQGEVPLFPGHGHSAEDMSRSSAADWIATAEETLDKAVQRSGGPVRVVGFSMGALLSILVAARHPTSVHSLVLMAPAARLCGIAAAAARALRHWPIVEYLRPLHTKGPPDVQDSAVRAAAPTWSHFPTALLRDLFVLQDSAEEASLRVQAPALMVLAPVDHVVDEAAARTLYRRLPHAGQIVMLAGGHHGMARDVSRQQLAQTVTRFFSQHV